MGRRSGVLGLINAIARDAARSQRQAVAAQQRLARDRDRAARTQMRLSQQHARRLDAESKRLERELKQLYLEDRQAETDDLNTDLVERIEDLRSILATALNVDDTIHFDTLRISEVYPPLDVPPGLTQRHPNPVRETFERIPCVSQPVGTMERLLHGENGKDNRVLRERQEWRDRVEREFQQACRLWREADRARLAQLINLEAKYFCERNVFLKKARQRNLEVDQLETAYRAGDPEAVVAYNAMVLERSVYPNGFPQEFRLAYVPESRELVIEYELPDVTAVPKEGEYKYIKTRDQIEETPRKPAEIKTLYQEVVSALTLRTIHEVFEADQARLIEMATFNGFVRTVDRATGRDIRPHLISVRATKERFLSIDLRRVDQKACLRNLGAQVSPQPDECVPVRPVVVFDMVDRRFVAGSDVLSELDCGSNLLDLSPFDFENLCGNLFSSMGLETRQTQASRDGGVDVVAFDTRPVIGGKVVIQAKRYKNTVGVSAVRDLFGTMMNEGASKGILVTTSSYGRDAYDFASGKPIELIDGGGLLYLLETFAGVRARIVRSSE